jgi:hypothetical protein
MILKNISGGAYYLSKPGKKLANNATTTVPDSLREDPDIAAAITAGKLQVMSYSSAADSGVEQDELASLTAASHTHANKTQLDLVTAGAHDVSNGNSHASVVLNNAHRTSNGTDHANVGLADTHRTGNGADHANVGLADTHRTGNGADHANVALGDTHRTGNGADHGNVALGDTHRTGNGSDHANVAAATAHVAIVAGNPHGTVPGDVTYTPAAGANWVDPDPTTVQAAIDRIAAQLAAVGAAPIP